LVCLAELAYGDIATYTPSEGMGVSYSLNIPEDTASSGSGPIYMQLKAPTHLQWFALGQGSRMISGKLFIVYSAPGDNVTLSPRSASGHVEPIYNPDIHASLLDGSGIENGTMTANIRCDNCMMLYNGKHLMDTDTWIWAVNSGDPLRSTNVSHQLHKHDWHGIYSLNLQRAIGGNSENPFVMPADDGIHYTVKPKSQQQTSDALLHKKRIAHGVMTSVAFVLLFPNFALTLFIIPSRWTVPWIHAPLQMFAVLLAIAGFIIGVMVSKDLRDTVSYHSIIGYVAVGGVVLFQPALGIIQHLRFRRIRQTTSFGIAHRWLGRGLSVLGIINGGLGFLYAPTMNPDIPPASPIAYGAISGSMGVIYIAVLLWKRYTTKRKARNDPQVLLPESKEATVTTGSVSTSSSTLCENVNTVDDPTKGIGQP
jgi:hypothetical protein